MIQGDNSDAVGSRPGGRQTRLTTLDPFLVKRPHASLGNDLYRFNHGCIRKSRLNRQYHIDGMKCRCRLLKGHGKGGSPTERALPQPTVAKQVTCILPLFIETRTRCFIPTPVAMATTFPRSPSSVAACSNHGAGRAQNKAFFPSM